MKTYEGVELDKKIESFMDRKMDKFPELRHTGKDREMDKKEFLRTFVRDIRFVFVRHAHV